MKIEMTTTLKTTIRTLFAALALMVAFAACTSQLETDGIHTAARTLTVDLGTKPAYNTTNASTRTNPETGQWEVGDVVEVMLKFNDGSQQTQTLTCTKAAVPANPGPASPSQWSAAPAIIVAPDKATKVSATYSYTSVADPRTGTKEQINGNVAEIPMPITGTLVLPTPTWTRRTALVVVENIPVGSTATIAYGTNSATAEWTNNTGTPSAANFHLAESDNFTLLIDNAATPYTNVFYEAGKKYILYANNTGPGTGGGDAQIINVDGNMSADAIATIFNTATSPNFNITGTATANVKDALKKVSGGKKINLLMPDVTTVADQAFTDCTALASISLPAATSIGTYAFFNCTALTTISLPLAESIGKNAFVYCTALASISLPAATAIGESAFFSCNALTSISLPAATSIGKGAFYECNALTRLELTQSAKEITVDKDAFGGFTNAANLTIVLDSSAAQANNNMGITVNGNTVTFANTDDGGIDDATFTFTAVIDPAGNPIPNTAVD